MLEFSSTFRYGVVLDTKGIREAVVQKEPIKALNSFAIMDLFDDVDEPTLILSGSVGLNINANAVFLEVGLTASVGFVATADIFDPFPDTSGGLVRPYELITYQGLNPMNWFEFTLSIYFELEMYIRVQIWLIFDTIVVYELSYSIREDIIDPIEITPEGVTPIVEVQDGQLLLSATSEAASAGLNCVSQEGSLGDETIECSIGEKFATGESVTKLTLSSGSGGRQILMMSDHDSIQTERMALTTGTAATFTGIQSPIDLGDVGALTLDYSSSGSTILSSGSIVLEQFSIQAGIANVAFTSIQKGAVKLPFPEVQDLTTTLRTCDNVYYLDGHTNLIIEADTINAECALEASGGESGASVLIDFGTGDCADGNDVKVDVADGKTTIALFRASDSLNKTFEFGPAFQVFEFQMSNCKDYITILKTLASTTSVTIYGRESDDTVTVGDETNGVNQIFSNVTVNGGPGTDSLMVVDTPASTGGKTETMSSKFLDGLLPTATNQFEYNYFETITLKLSDSGTAMRTLCTHVCLCL